MEIKKDSILIIIGKKVMKIKAIQTINKIIDIKEIIIKIRVVLAQVKKIHIKIIMEIKEEDCFSKTFKISLFIINIR